MRLPKVTKYPNLYANEICVYIVHCVYVLEKINVIFTKLSDCITLSARTGLYRKEFAIISSRTVQYLLFEGDFNIAPYQPSGIDNTIACLCIKMSQTPFLLTLKVHYPVL